MAVLLFYGKHLRFMTIGFILIMYITITQLEEDFEKRS
jgi:hypothetical protein